MIYKMFPQQSYDLVTTNYDIEKEHVKFSSKQTYVLVSTNNGTKKKNCVLYHVMLSVLKTAELFSKSFSCDRNILLT